MKQAINTPFAHQPNFAPPTYTVWVNNSEDHVKFRLLTSNKVGMKASGVAFMQISLAPGEKVQLPSEYDSAIRVEKKGKVIGGLCPWLMKEGEDSITLDEALDFRKDIEQLTLNDIAKKIEKEKAQAQAKEVYKELQEVKKAKGRPKKISE